MNNRFLIPRPILVIYFNFNNKTNSVRIQAGKAYLFPLLLWNMKKTIIIVSRSRRKKDCSPNAIVRSNVGCRQYCWYPILRSCLVFIRNSNLTRCSLFLFAKSGTLSSCAWPGWHAYPRAAGWHSLVYTSPKVHTLCECPEKKNLFKYFLSHVIKNSTLNLLNYIDPISTRFEWSLTFESKVGYR